MASVLDLSRFWEHLETNFPLAGPRNELRGRFGPGVVAALEKGGVLVYLRTADVVACPHPGGQGCPRQVIELSDGRFQGVCGNDPPECDDIDLVQDDIEVFGVEPLDLCKSLRGPLRTGGRAEALPGLQNVFRAGTFKPDESTRHSVYLVVRCAEHEYAAAFDAVRSQQEGSSFAILIPTDRFVAADTIRQMGTLGIPIIALQGLVDADRNGQLTTTSDVIRLFGGIGRRTSAAVSLSAPVVAQVRTHHGWQDLDESGYGRLIENADDYDIMADERSQVVWKRDGDGKPHQRADRVQASYFRMIRAAVDKVGYFDPSAHGPEDLNSSKQIFQRARKTIDIKNTAERDGNDWRLFKSVKVDNHVEYHFQPDPDFCFALIFHPYK
jgi:hypothetical protein